MSDREKTASELIAERRELLDQAEKLDALITALNQGVKFIQRARGELALVTSGDVQASVELPRIPATNRLIERLQNELDHWWALNCHYVSRRAVEMVNDHLSYFVHEDDPESEYQAPVATIEKLGEDVPF